MFKDLIPKTLPPMFDTAVEGRVLIFDADSLAYRVAATVKRLPTAIQHFKRGVMEFQFLVGAQSSRVHLTAADSFKAGRGGIIASREYQANRTGKTRPPLLEPLREAMVNPENWVQGMEVFNHRDFEADDWVMIDSYTYKENGVVLSDDKDLRQTPYPYYEQRVGEVRPSAGWGDIWWTVLPSGAEVLEGQGRIFMWAQMLMGDTADHIKGLERYHGTLVGPKLTYELLAGQTDPDYVVNLVLDAYRARDQNPIPEAYLLFMLRNPNDYVMDYLQQYNLSEKNRRFLNECENREWFVRVGALCGKP